MEISLSRGAWRWLGALLGMVLLAGCPQKVCEPGQSRPCYSGPANTQNVGLCRAGVQVCNADGEGYGACQGEVLPAAERCGVDANCDGTPGPTCGPVTLAMPPSPWFLAPDAGDGYVYWGRRAFNAPGGVYRVRKDGAGYATLYSNEEVRGVAVDLNGVFWLGSDKVRFGSRDGSAPARTVYTLPASGTMAATQVLGAGCTGPFPLSLIVDNTHVYFTTYSSGCNPLVRVEKGGANAAGFAASGALGAGLAADGAALYFTQGVYRLAKDGGAPLQLSPEGVEGLAVDETHVYAQTNSSLVRARTDGGERRLLASWPSCGGTHYPYNVAVDGAHVYWLEQCSKTLRRIKKDGTGEEIVYTAPNCLMSLMLDGDSIYWSECDEPTGRIMKMAK